MLSVIIVAAGKGERMGGVKKQFLPLNGIPLFLHSVKLFSKIGAQEIIIAVPKEDVDLAKNLLLKYGLSTYCKVVAGGKSRQESVKLAFSECKKDLGLIAIHDAARPFVKYEDALAVCKDAEKYGAATLAIPVSDTVKEAKEGFITATIPRESLYLAQTPQVFKKSLYKKALSQTKGDYTDDCQLLEHIGVSVKITQGSASNKKITTIEDKTLLTDYDGGKNNMRIGHGYDVHRFAKNRRLILCGVEIPYDEGLLGHSDADVATHALMDALLGAAALGDIGKLFPDTDSKWKDASSLSLLDVVMDKIYLNGYHIQNIDLTIIAQQPKISPYISDMKRILCQKLQISENQINIKATTEEGLGFTGRKEGISAHCVVLLH